MKITYRVCLNPQKSDLNANFNSLQNREMNINKSFKTLFSNSSFLFFFNLNSRSITCI